MAVEVEELMKVELSQRPASVVTGSGMSLPTRVVSNQHFADYLETSDEWIQDRTGIRERRWVKPGTGASELAEPAARDAIAAAGLSVGDIDGIVFATVTPDRVFPSAACSLQGRLGTKGFAFDVNAVCSGFLYALSIADSLINRGLGKNILVVGADIFSQIIDHNDRGTCILFGDGAGALVVSSSKFGQVTGDAAVPSATGQFRGERGILSSELFSDGSQGDILCVPIGTSNPISAASIERGDQYVKMAGREVFKLAVRSLVEVSEGILSRNGLNVSDVDHFISHQANQRILAAMAKQLGVDESKVPSNVDRVGNTSAASLPILLAECSQSGRLKRGDLILLSAFGGGVTWGAMLLRW